MSPLSSISRGLSQISTCTKWHRSAYSAWISANVSNCGPQALVWQKAGVENVTATGMPEPIASSRLTW